MHVYFYTTESFSLYLTKSNCTVSQGQLFDYLVMCIINEALEKLLHQQLAALFFTDSKDRGKLVPESFTKRKTPTQ